MPLVQKLTNDGVLIAADVVVAEKLCNKLPGLFPSEPPSLLHGDLWAGNMMPVGHNGADVPCIYDPAVYHGHREMDIGMSLLFGGFDSRFYDAYNHNYPLEKGWHSRVSLTQLYPLLVHAVLFGGGYVGRCREIIGEFA